MHSRKNSLLSAAIASLAYRKAATKFEKVRILSREYGIPLRTIQHVVGVPKSTAGEWASAENDTEPKLGRPSILTEEEDKLLCEFVRQRAESKNPVDNADIKIEIRRYLQHCKTGCTLFYNCNLI